jgi:DNA mismatch repair protein MSH6
MDADIGMAELDLIYMKGSKAHSGFPEVSYGKFASILVSKGLV